MGSLGSSLNLGSTSACGCMGTQVGMGVGARHGVCSNGQARGHGAAHMAARLPGGRAPCKATLTDDDDGMPCSSGRREGDRREGDSTGADPDDDATPPSSGLRMREGDSMAPDPMIWDIGRRGGDSMAAGGWRSARCQGAARATCQPVPGSCAEGSGRRACCEPQSDLGRFDGTIWRMRMPCVCHAPPPSYPSPWRWRQ